MKYIVFIALLMAATPPTVVSFAEKSEAKQPQESIASEPTINYAQFLAALGGVAEHKDLLSIWAIQNLPVVRREMEVLNRGFLRAKKASPESEGTSVTSPSIALSNSWRIMPDDLLATFGGIGRLKLRIDREVRSLDARIASDRLAREDAREDARARKEKAQAEAKELQDDLERVRRGESKVVLKIGSAQLPASEQEQRQYWQNRRDEVSRTARGSGARDSSVSPSPEVLKTALLQLDKIVSGEINRLAAEWMKHAKSVLDGTDVDRQLAVMNGLGRWAGSAGQVMSVFRLGTDGAEPVRISAVERLPFIDISVAELSGLLQHKHADVRRGVLSYLTAQNPRQTEYAVAASIALADTDASIREQAMATIVKFTVRNEDCRKVASILLESAEAEVVLAGLKILVERDTLRDSLIDKIKPLVNHASPQIRKQAESLLRS